MSSELTSNHLLNVAYKDIQALQQQMSLAFERLRNGCIPNESVDELGKELLFKNRCMITSIFTDIQHHLAEAKRSVSSAQVTTVNWKG